MTKIYLIRHGETDWNRERRYQGQKDIPLNHLGRWQAEQLAKRFLNEQMHVDAIYSSSLSRAKETAEIIANHLNLQVLVHEGLKERYFGMLEGMKLEEFKAKHPDIDMRTIDKFESFRVEPLYSFKQRMYQAVLETAKKHLDQTVMLVSHGAAINTFLYEISNGELGTGMTKIVNTGITTISYHHSTDHWEINDINNISHIGA